MNHIKRGEFMGAEIGTVVVDVAYCIRIEATPAGARIVPLLGMPFTVVGPEEDSGRRWFQFEYTEAMDRGIQDLVDVLAEIRFNKPNFGQMQLFDDANSA